MGTFCKNCGGEIPPNSKVCPKCGTTVDNDGILPRDIKRPWLLALSVFSTTCCCIPIGILSVYFTMRGDNLADKGDLIAAERSYCHAELSAVTAIILGGIFGVIYAIACIVAES